MADQVKSAGRSRRARRREKLQAQSRGPAEEHLAPDGDETLEDEPQAADDEDAAEQPAEAAEERPSRQRRRASERRGARVKKRRGAGRKSESESDDPLEQIRDRNRRVREQAAANRRGRKRERGVAAAQGLDTSELVDDALARSTHVAFNWIRRHFNTVQWVLIVAIAAGIGWQIYAWRSARSTERESDQLLEAVAAAHGRVGSDEASPGSYDLRPQFATEEARLTAAAEAYVTVVDASGGDAVTLFGKLGLAGILFDQGRYDEALSEYQQVKDSELGAYDRDVKGRALEGIGLCLEAKQDPDGALRVFRELENTETAGFVSLARYHQARVLYAKGEKKPALELLKAALEKLRKDDATGGPPGYLEMAVRGLQQTIDPTSAAEPPSVSPADLAKLRQQMQALQDLVARNKPDLSEKELEQLMRDPSQVEKLLRDLGSLPANLAQGVPSATPAPASSP